MTKQAKLRNYVLKVAIEPIVASKQNMSRGEWHTISYFNQDDPSAPCHFQNNLIRFMLMHVIVEMKLAAFWTKNNPQPILKRQGSYQLECSSGLGLA